MTADPHPAGIAFRHDPEPAQIATSGLGIVVESLHGGRFGRRLFASQGFIGRNVIAAHGVPGFTPPDPRSRELPFEAFDLEVDGQSLQGGWEWVDDRLEDAASGVAHAVIHLRSSRRPVEIEVHTLADGTGLFARWLRITNTGDRPAALGRAAPWCGLLWGGPETVWPPAPRYLKPGQPPFVLGRCVSEDWGREGAFKWAPLPPDTLRIEHIKGTSGNDDPAFLLRNDLTGEVAVGALAWRSE